MIQSNTNKNEITDYEFWYRQKVVERIWAYQRKLKLTPKELYNKSEYEFNEFDTLRAAKLFFGSWKGALAASGLHGNGQAASRFGKESGERPQFSKPQVLAIIKGLADSGEDMSPENIIVMHNDIWRWACGPKGYFSHWPTALRSAGVNLNALNLQPYWTENQVKNRILDLYESQLILSTKFIRDNFWYLYRFGLRLFGSWHNAVNVTGLGYETVGAEYSMIENNQFQFQSNLQKVLQGSGRPIRQLEPSGDSIAPSLGPLGLFCTDTSDGTIIGTVLRSWWPGLERMLEPVVNNRSCPKVELYYLQGEPRAWKNDKVQFICSSDLVLPSHENGMDQYINEILSLQYNVRSFL
ncbi:MAG: hypothetical protein JSV49_03585 [Thermoplasmata archaeon]|nr:MAG: hypothetical protein JSV49_03585 [Thermoplasmata archaeon]